VIHEAVSALGRVTIEGVKAEEFRVFFFDPTRPLSRTQNPLVGLFRLTRFHNGGWFVPHVGILEHFLRYQRTLRPNEHVRYLTKITEPSLIDRDTRDVYNRYTILEHEVRFGPQDLPRSERFISIYDSQGGCTGYCRFKDADYAKEVIKLIESPNGLDNFLVLQPKTSLRLNFPTDNS
jgi:hypothetical protein